MQEYVATRRYRAPELNGSFFTKVRNDIARKYSTEMKKKTTKAGAEMLVMAYGVSYGLPAINCTAKMLLKPLRMFFTKEEDKPNFTGSFYSKPCADAHLIIPNQPEKLHHITKISHYNKVVNIPNSMTILGKLLEKHKGHNEILEMYKSHIEPGFKWSNFTVEEQAKVIVAPRSNNEMDGSKLSKEFPEMLPITEALIKYVFEPNKRT
ncbi:hypothetical protein DY000_02010511 [Brassica cretica]|uniref:Uncharacterized protein n=1 Tax=Brassica cretica TaxID=69181 RepID=A0ABQ7CE76_BRACR|nr:hypothetical protein DY000_02010511 [Brassica cretica]